MASSKSVLVTHFGGYDSLVVVNHPLKKLEDNDVEVDVYYCGVNFADLYTRQGLIPKTEIPFVLGMECSGIIKRIGKKVAPKFNVGDRVVCYDHEGGLHRAKVIISASKCFSIPEYVTLKDAAALFVNYLTAYYCIHYLGSLYWGRSIFVHSCAGGVGLAVSQLGNRVRGIEIFGTTSPQKAQIAKQNGVQHVLEYDNYKETLKNFRPNGVDLFIDNQAGGNFEENLKLLRRFGRLILIGANHIIKDEKQLNDENLSILKTQVSTTDLIMNNASVSGLHLGVLAQTDPDFIDKTLNKLFMLLAEKEINLIIDSVWKMDEVVQATKRLQERQNVGKVLLMIKSE